MSSDTEILAPALAFPLILGRPAERGHSADAISV